MKRLKKPLLFSLAVLPVAAVGGYFTVLYQMELYDPAVFAEAIAQVGGMEVLLAISVVQVAMYTAFCGIFGYILAEKTGLMKRIRMEKEALLRVLEVSLVGGIALSLDYWTFGSRTSGIREATAAGMTVNGWLASVLYGGVFEELLLRLFVMSGLTWVVWKIFFRKAERAPESAAMAANVIAALLFAAGHLPATYTTFGELTPLLLLRCFLFNGGLGLMFGRIYRKYGIQYAMVSHAVLHIVSKSIWLIFI